MLRFELNLNHFFQMNTDPETGEVVMELDTYSLEKELRTGLKLINFYAPW